SIGSQRRFRLHLRLMSGGPGSARRSSVPGTLDDLTSAAGSHLERRSSQSVWTKTQPAGNSGHYKESILCSPRGGPRISRSMIASRNPDVDASNIVIPVLNFWALAPVCVSSAPLLVIEGGPS